MATSTHSGVTGAVDFDLSKLKLADLKRVATEVSVATKGTKSDLIVRLERCGNTAVNQALESLSLVSDSAALSHSVPSVASDNSPASVICPTCDKPFTHKLGEESILCEGACRMWFHRCCAGLSKSAYGLLSTSATPFHCFHCRLSGSEAEISALKQQVSSLQSELEGIKAAISSTSPKSSVINGHATLQGSSVSAGSHHRVSVGTSLLAGNSRPKSLSSLRQRRSIVIYGIKEQPQGTHFHARMDADEESVFQLLNSLTSIFKSSIQECLRLGRYCVGTSRPLKVTFMKATDVFKIFSSKHKLATRPDVSLKPFLSPSERKAESLLLKKRRELIASGSVDVCAIRIRGSSLFIDGRKHGFVDNLVYKLSSPPSRSSSPVPENSPGRVVQPHSSSSHPPSELEHVLTSSAATSNTPVSSPSQNASCESQS